MDRRIVEDLTKRFAPEVWNGLGRTALVAVAVPMQFTGLAVAAAAKAAIEHGMLKPLFYGFVKLPTRGVIELHNRLAPQTGFAPVAPNARYYPHLKHFNWGDRTRTRANGNSDRPNRMNWFWNPEAARRWGPWQGGRAAAPGGRGAGNFRIADWRLRLRHLPKWREPSVSDKFNPDTMYSPKKAHSARWYQEARNWISQQIVQEVEARFEYALTPRLNAYGTHFILADGTNPRAVNRNANGDITNAPTAADFAAGGAITDADRAAAAAYYPDTELWLALHSMDAGIRGNAIAYVVDDVTTRWKVQHYRLLESLRLQVAYEHFESLKRDLTYGLALQEWLQSLDTLRLWSYGIDDLVLKILNGL